VTAACNSALLPQGLKTGRGLRMWRAVNDPTSARDLIALFQPDFHGGFAVKRAGSLMTESRIHLQDAGLGRVATSRQRAGSQWARLSILAAAFLTLGAGAALADKIKQPIAVFSGLDKITGRIITFEVATNETVQFGTLRITDRVCYSRPPTEAPRTDSFVEIDNIDADNHSTRIFTGWMFAGSPSLHALDHPVYDVWLLRCKGPGQLIPSPPETAAEPAPATDQTKAAAQPKPPANKEQVQRALPPLPGAPVTVAPPPGFNAPTERQTPTRRFDPASPVDPGSPPPNDGNNGF